MKRISVITLIALLLLPAYSYAFAVPPDSCPCSTQTINETTGAEILAEICPGGELAQDGILVFNQEELSVSLDEPVREFGVGFFGPVGQPACELRQGLAGVLAGISNEELQTCRVTILEACGLNMQPIPTLSEWGLIATAGLLGLIGLGAIRRKNIAA